MIFLFKIGLFLQILKGSQCPESFLLVIKLNKNRLCTTHNEELFDEIVSLLLSIIILEILKKDELIKDINYK